MQRVYPVVLLVSLLLAGAGLCLPPNWDWQNPSPTVNDMSAVSMISAAAGWAVGAFGTILKTTDGGATWHQMPSPTHDILVAVCFVDTQRGWIAATGSYDNDQQESENFVLNTTDGGVTWTRHNLTLASGFWVRDMQFVDANHGWVMASNGGTSSTMFYTGDGGATWTVRAAAISTCLNHFQFVNDSLGWAVGNTSVPDSGRILHTTNGGATWSAQYSVFMNWIYALFFSDTLNGWAGGEGGSLLHTTDGGLHWQAQEDSVLVEALGFADNLNGFAIGVWGDSTRVLRTTNGGTTWQRSGAGSNRRIGGVSVRDATHAVVVGENGTVMRTEDGSTWTEVSRHQINQSMGEIFFADSLHGWVGGITLRDGQWPGTVWHTVDGGVNWTEQNPGFLGWVDGLDFVDASNGWAVQSGGIITHTTDGGETWTPQLQYDTTRTMLDVDFCDSQHGFVVGFRTIWRTNDGGQSWNTSTNPLWGELSDVKAVSPQIAWAVGIGYSSNYTHDTSIVVHTTDGGESWETQPYPDTRLNSVDFLDADHGCISGAWYNDHSVLRYTTDGGATWNSPENLPFIDFTRVAFRNQSDLWAVANSGTVARSTDGGASWTAENYVTNWSLLTLTFTDPGHGWILGQNCAIMRYHETVPMAVHPAPKAIPAEFSFTAFPNPFNPVTLLTFTLTRAERITVAVYDLTGRLVETLCDEVRPAGVHTLRFDGSRVASGVYFARVETQESSRTVKLMLLK